MEKGTKRLAQQLLSTIFSTQVLKSVSVSLEEISANKHFKSHTNSIVNDSNLTKSQKKTQLTYVIKSVENQELYSFLSSIEEEDWWLFNSGKIDYFDRFVQSFQQLTEEIEVVYLTTAVPLNQQFTKSITKDLSQSFNKTVIINHQIKSSIIGGAQVKIENMVFDYSLKYKFRQFERQWLKSLKSTDKAIGRHIPD